MGKKSRKKNQAKTQKAQSQQAAPKQSKKSVKSSGGGFNPIQTWKNLSQVTRFVLTFAFLIICFYIIIWPSELYQLSFVPFITDLDAKLASIILTLIKIIIIKLSE